MHTYTFICGVVNLPLFFFCCKFKKILHVLVFPIDSLQDSESNTASEKLQEGTRMPLPCRLGKQRVCERVSKWYCAADEVGHGGDWTHYHWDGSVSR